MWDSFSKFVGVNLESVSERITVINNLILFFVLLISLLTFALLKPVYPDLIRSYPLMVAILIYLVASSMVTFYCLYRTNIPGLGLWEGRGPRPSIRNPFAGIGAPSLLSISYIFNCPLSISLGAVFVIGFVLTCIFHKALNHSVQKFLQSPRGKKMFSGKVIAVGVSYLFFYLGMCALSLPLITLVAAI